MGIHINEIAHLLDRTNMSSMEKRFILMTLDDCPKINGYIEREVAADAMDLILEPHIKIWMKNKIDRPLN